MSVGTALYYTAQVAQTASLNTMIKNMEYTVTNDGQIMFKMPEAGQEVSDPKKLSIGNQLNELNIAGSKNPKNKKSTQETKIDEFLSKTQENVGVESNKLTEAKKARETASSKPSETQESPLKELTGDSADVLPPPDNPIYAFKEKYPEKPYIINCEFSPAFKVWFEQTYKIKLKVKKLSMKDGILLAKEEMLNWELRVYKTLYEQFIKREKIHIQTALEGLIGKVIRRYAEKIATDPETNFGEVFLKNFPERKLNSNLHGGGGLIVSKMMRVFELLFGIRKGSPIDHMQRKELSDACKTYRNDLNLYEKDEWSIVPSQLYEFKFLQKIQQYYVEEKGEFLSVREMCCKIFGQEPSRKNKKAYFDGHFRNQKKSGPMLPNRMFFIKGWIETTFTNPRYKAELLLEVEDWCGTYGGGGAYFDEENPHFYVIGKIIEYYNKYLWQDGEKPMHVTALDRILQEVKEANPERYDFPIGDYFFNNKGYEIADRESAKQGRDQAWKVFKLFIEDVFEAQLKITGQREEIELLLEKIEEYRDDAVLENHNPYMINTFTYRFHLYLFTSYTMGLDPTTCQFIDDILAWTRHHGKREPSTIPIFVKDKDCPNGYDILLVPVPLKRHGAATVKHDPNTKLTLHGPGMKPAISNLILEERFRHLIELTWHYIEEYKKGHGGSAPSLAELKAYYLNEFKGKTFDASKIVDASGRDLSFKHYRKYWEQYKREGKSDEWCLKHLPLWGEYSELNIEGMIDRDGKFIIREITEKGKTITVYQEQVIGVFADSVRKWNTEGEAVWFTTHEKEKYQEFYNDVWLYTRGKIIENIRREERKGRVYWFISKILEPSLDDPDIDVLPYHPNGYSLDDLFS